MTPSEKVTATAQSASTREFISLFNQTARYHHRYKVFADFVTVAGIALHNAAAFDQELEQQYLDIVKQYEKDDVMRFTQLFAVLTMELESHPRDVLGELYMSLDISSGHLGQFFTPFSISRMMARLQLGNNDPYAENPHGFVSVSDPACGAGGMIIAFAEALQERGHSPQQQMWAQCIDIDPIAAWMCYIQLTLLHIPAEVIIGNTLSMAFSRRMYTLAHYLGDWSAKLRRRTQAEAMRKLLQPGTDLDQKVGHIITEPATSPASSVGEVNAADEVSTETEAVRYTDRIAPLTQLSLIESPRATYTVTTKPTPVAA
ncbi:N-6 DNA methylase [Pokkaliibacter sp. MBI-7]|uniref:N-6 DNA methylase n=1 Tax=Pokkaliibacter sp. MBI-7 TaxID=3040600 RepID=UPI00244982BE|nr:N-6 DNA methylase [Pokkaliibacter sp. MBI-7]MDH2436764.1 N-6 DNA methylase [Pokkaliibacter sp. MBI-7]